jgi:hypothetical protein
MGGCIVMGYGGDGRGAEGMGGMGCLYGFACKPSCGVIHNVAGLVLLWVQLGIVLI